MEELKSIKLSSVDKIGTVATSWLGSFTINMAEINEVLTAISTSGAILYTIYRVRLDFLDKRNEKKGK